MLTNKSFFDLAAFAHPGLFPPEAQVWQPLNALKQYMDACNYPAIDRTVIQNGVPLKQHVIYHDGRYFELSTETLEFGDTTKGGLIISHSGQPLAGAALLMAGSIFLGERIAIGRGVLVESGAMVKAPAIIGEMSEVRQGAYLRGYCLAGKRCILGHATEIKHSIFLDDAKAGHFAYLGDSILGNNANLGAGTKFANLRFLPGNVTIFYKRKRFDTGRRKFGAILGDNCQTGCNSVTNPGTLMGRGSILVPNATAKPGFHQPGTVLR
jgi:acetyltransferase-like isoleucine patch superfamily enzyme